MWVLRKWKNFSAIFLSPTFHFHPFIHSFILCISLYMNLHFPIVSFRFYVACFNFKDFSLLFQFSSLYESCLLEKFFLHQQHHHVKAVTMIAIIWYLNKFVTKQLRIKGEHSNILSFSPVCHKTAGWMFIYIHKWLLVVWRNKF